ncbi:CapA family protein [Candidatus Parcubacteria bacterium]|nr:MAG: CapA family protein [Candidatus Parcubacteria bacterium]
MFKKFFGFFILCLGLWLLPGRALAQSESELNLIFGGDVMLGRAVRDQIAKRGGNDGAWVMQNLAPEFKAANFAFVNLESPFAPGAALGYSLIFRADPKHVSALTSAGIDAVSLANNHAKNQGRLGLQTSLSLLTQKGIGVAGAGLTLKSGYKPAQVQVKKTKVSVLAYTYNEHLPLKNSTPTVAGMLTYVMQAEVKKAKAKGGLVIVSMHAGNEYTLRITNQQRNFARAAVDAGADLVIGHHPHWVQPIEIYKTKPIFYSLGNLVFDQPWSLETQLGLVAKVKLVDGQIKQIKLLPIKIDLAAKPRWMNEVEARKVLNRIDRPSGVINF